MAQEENLDIFEKCMGTFNSYQKWIAFLIILIKFPVGWHLLNIIIIAPRPLVTCVNSTNECDELCALRTIDPSPFTQTVPSQWNLVCGHAYLADFAQMLMMLGVMAGSFLFGVLGDKYGRRLPMVVAIGIQAIAATVIAFVPWYWLFLFLRFVIGTATGGTMTLSFVLLMELVGKRWRIVVGTMYQTPTWLGHLSLAAIGYYLRDWRYSQLLVGAPSFLMLSYYWLLPESPRYLLSAGKTEEAIKTMVHIASMNGLPTENIESEVKAFVAATSTPGVNQKGNFGDLFKPRKICWRTVIMTMNWVTVGLGFYGVAQYAAQTSGDVFLNIAISAAMEIPGTIAATLLLLKIGRKFTAMALFLIAGVPLLIIPFFQAGSLWIPAMALFGLFGLAGLFATIYVYTGELYPTYIRSLGVGFVGMMCRVGTVLAPFVATLGHYDFATWLPPVIFGIFPLINCLFILYLPETKNDQLPSTLEEALDLGKSKRVRNP